jgi:hypothetical protein
MPEHFKTQLQAAQTDREDAIRPPVPGAVVELKSPDGSRYARTGPHGRFVFDGLAEGKYSLTAPPTIPPMSDRWLHRPNSPPIKTVARARFLPFPGFKEPGDPK